MSDGSLDHRRTSRMSFEASASLGGKRTLRPNRKDDKHAFMIFYLLFKFFSIPRW